MSKVESELAVTKAKLSPSSRADSTVIDVDDYEEWKTKKPNPQQTVERCRAAFKSGKTRSIQFRKEQLKNLLRMLDENSEALEKALAKDLRKCAMESQVTEIDFLRNDVRVVLKELASWANPKPVKKPYLNALDNLYVYSDPYGVVLVMGAWNYPLLLTLSPVIGAIAGGNCVIIKPSEVSPASAEIMAELLPKYLDKDAYQVYLGGIPETTELLKERFDYIFYTGSTTVGKIIQEAAAKHLTPVTLELGGKSPAYVDISANMDIAVKRLLWGKLINAGQTCVAPDYILCTKETQEKFLRVAKKTLRTWYGPDVKKSPDFARIVTRKHFDRLCGFLSDKSKIAIGGTCDASELFIEPTILINVSPLDPVMQEEIFGPILPIITVKNVSEAVDFINSREKPLALYIFTRNKKDKELLLKNTSSGGVGINETVMHIVVDTLPFGGVGASGMGRYHGKASFDTFTHKKSVLDKDYNVIVEKLSEAKYPPYTSGKSRYISFVTKHRGYISFKFLWYIFCFLLGMGVTVLFYYFHK